jgi:hypothetical protein
MSEQVSRAARDQPGSDEAGFESVPQRQPQRSDDALTSLTKYIPTEVLTLYLPAVAIVAALDPPLVVPGKKLTYWIFALGLTPLISLLVYVRRRVLAGLALWPSWTEFPLWSVLAGIIAFLAWALALPGNPYLEKPAMHVASGFAALLASTLLSLLEPIFVRRR